MQALLIHRVEVALDAVREVLEALPRGATAAPSAAVGAPAPVSVRAEGSSESDGATRRHASTGGVLPEPPAAAAAVTHAAAASATHVAVPAATAVAHPVPPTSPTPSAGLAFADIMRMVAAGETPPGIKDVPDRLSEDSADAMAAPAHDVPRKPWADVPPSAAAAPAAAVPPDG